MNKNIYFIFLIILIQQICFARPQQIIIIRHGEKIDDLHSDLSVQGCQRAYALTNFFSKYSSNVVAIFAQQPSRLGRSIRPIETVAPTAEALHIKINNFYLKNEADTLAKEILTNPSYNGRTVIVSWEHTEIISLVSALGVVLPPKLQVWPGTVFDQAWVLTDKVALHQFDLAITAEYVLPTDIVEEQSGVQNWGVEHPPQDNGLKLDPVIIDNCSAGNDKLNAVMNSVVMYPLPKIEN